MTRITTGFTVFLAFAIGAAEARATPEAGSKELRIGQTYLPPLTVMNGFHSFEPDGGGTSISGLGLGAGFGYFATDNVEVGGSASFVLLKIGDTTPSGPALSPFIRFFTKRGRIGLFAELAGGFQLSQTENTSSTMWIIGGELGADFFVTDDWAVRVAPTVRHYEVSTRLNASLGQGTSSNSAAANVFGLDWGLAAYF